MKRLLSFIVLLITLIGCSNNSTSTSEDKYYSDNDLSNILSVLNSKSENIDKIYYSTEIYSVILNENKIDDFLNIINVSYLKYEDSIYEQDFFKNSSSYFIISVSKGNNIWLRYLYLYNNLIYIIYDYLNSKYYYGSTCNIDETLLINLFNFSLD